MNVGHSVIDQDIVGQNTRENVVYSSTRKADVRAVFTRVLNAPFSHRPATPPPRPNMLQNHQKKERVFFMSAHAILFHCDLNQC